MKRAVKVVGKNGQIIWANVYTDMAEMLDDLRVLLKTSTFGGIEFMVTINRV